MPVNPATTSKSGMNSFMAAAKVLCRLVGLFGPTIRARFPDRTALLAVLTAAEGVCTLLPAAVMEQVTEDAFTGDYDPAPSDVIPGQTE